MFQPTSIQTLFIQAMKDQNAITTTKTQLATHLVPSQPPRPLRQKGTNNHKRDQKSNNAKEPPKIG